MADSEYPVYVTVDRGGRAEQVRVGTAVRSGDGFLLRMGDLRLGAPQPAAPAWGAAPPPREAAPAQAWSGRGGGAPAGEPPPGGMLLPNYGRSKGQPVYGASLGDLEYYAAGCRRSLADPGKARWHDKERVLLAAIEGEIIRQKGMPPMDAGSGSGGGGGGGGFDSGPPPFDDRPPPDDDVPF